MPGMVLRDQYNGYTTFSSTSCDERQSYYFVSIILLILWTSNNALNDASVLCLFESHRMELTVHLEDVANSLELTKSSIDALRGLSDSRFFSLRFDAVMRRRRDAIDASATGIFEGGEDQVGLGHHRASVEAACSEAVQ